MNASADDDLIFQYEKVLNQTKPRKELLPLLQNLILTYGIPNTKRDGIGFTLRGRIWKVILSYPIDIKKYKSLVEVGPFIKEVHGPHLRSDATDIERDIMRSGYIIKSPEFNNDDMIESVIRLGHAYFHLISRNSSISEYNQGSTQKMFHFLHEMPEIDAFFCFIDYHTYSIPTYVNCFGQGEPNTGVTRANDLIHEILKKLDPEAYKFCSNMYMANKVKSIVWGCFSENDSCFREDIPSLLRVWDMAIAFGPAMWPIFTAAMVILVLKKYPDFGKNLNKQAGFYWPLLEVDNEMITLVLSIIRTLQENYPDILSRLFYHSIYLGV